MDKVLSWLIVLMVTLPDTVFSGYSLNFIGNGEVNEHIGVVVGGSIAALAIVVILVLTYMFFKRR